MCLLSEMTYKMTWNKKVSSLPHDHHQQQQQRQQVLVSSNNTRQASLIMKKHIGTKLVIVSKGSVIRFVKYRKRMKMEIDTGVKTFMQKTECIFGGTHLHRRLPSNVKLTWTSYLSLHLSYLQVPSMHTYFFICLFVFFYFPPYLVHDNPKFGKSSPQIFR